MVLGAVVNAAVNAADIGATVRALRPPHSAHRFPAPPRPAPTPDTLGQAMPKVTQVTGRRWGVPDS